MSKDDPGPPAGGSFLRSVAREALRTAAVGGVVWLYLTVVPESLGLALKWILLFAGVALGLCLWLWWRDPRAGGGA